MRLNLGAGNRIEKDWINHDLIKHRLEIDVAFDLNYHSWRTAGRLIEFMIDNKIEYFETIKAWDVVEHLDSVINFLNNCWGLLDREGVLHIKACGWKNPSYHTDPTHKRAFDIDSFDYFDPSSELGKEYGYYTDKRWQVFQKVWDRNGNVVVKMHPIK